ncbi:hypothetical protein WJX82_008262 [Trebouxia sp. C0006]
MGAALSHSLHHSRRPAQLQQCARLMSICRQQAQESSKYMLASTHASIYYQHPFCTETASGISSSRDRICKQQLQKELPTKVVYCKLVDMLWPRHNFTSSNRVGNDIGAQYRSGIYHHTDEQKQIAEQKKSQT